MVPPAHALFWEDAQDDDNNPSETHNRPDHFSLFDWVGDIDQNAKKGHYKEMDNHDHGPSVNNGDRTLVVVTSAVVGLGTGLFLSYEFTENNSDLTSNMFVGGALGLCAGIAVGALIMPADYNVDQQARTDYLKERQAWLQDPQRMRIAQAFHPSPVSFSFNF
jgi:hypothetical protein